MRITAEHPKAAADLLILAPRRVRVPGSLPQAAHDPEMYESLLASMQRLRGSVYLEDGAVLPSELTADGRHIQQIDRRSWHLLALSEGEVCACLRFLDETSASTVDELWVRQAGFAKSPASAPRFRRAVQSELARARREGLRFGEVGGWAISKNSRCSLQAARILLAAYALLQMLGGCVGVATATLRHGSAGLLRRIGLTGVEADGIELPSYYDAHYGCDMELLRFDSRRPDAKYAAKVRELMAELRSAPVLCDEVWPRFEPITAVAVRGGHGIAPFAPTHQPAPLAGDCMQQYPRGATAELIVPSSH